MPDNTVYYHLAYIAASVIYAAYAVRLAMKWTRLRAQKARAALR